MENMDNQKLHSRSAEHELMLSDVYQDDVELLYLDCCLSELLKERKDDI